MFFSLSDIVTFFLSGALRVMVFYKILVFCVYMLRQVFDWRLFGEQIIISLFRMNHKKNAGATQTDEREYDTVSVKVNGI